MLNLDYIDVLEKDMKRYGRAYTTLRNYKTSLKVLIGRYDLDVDTLRKEPKIHGQLVIDNVLDIDSLNISIHSYISSMKALLRAYDLDYKIEWKYPKHRDRKYRDLMPTVSDLRYILNKASLKQKVVLLLLISSGMRIGSLEHLRLKDFVYHADSGIVKINVYSTKIRHHYVTFATREFWDVFQQWLGELETSKEIKDDDRIFEKYFFGNRGRKKTAKNWWTLRISAELNSKLFNKCKLFKRNNGDARFTAHTLRKFFKTACVASGIPDLYSERLMGHKSGIQQIYFRPSDEMIMQEYRKVVESLTINGGGTTFDAGYETRLKTLEENVERMRGILS